MVASPAHGDPVLDGLIEEALKNSPEIKASQSRIDAARLKIPQSGSLPDPMVMIGYQNESFDRILTARWRAPSGCSPPLSSFFFPANDNSKKK